MVRLPLTASPSYIPYGIGCFRTSPCRSGAPASALAYAGAKDTVEEIAKGLVALYATRRCGSTTGHGQPDPDVDRRLRRSTRLQPGRYARRGRRPDNTA